MSIPTNLRDYQRWTWQNPVEWTELCLGRRLWGKQAEILRMIRDHPLSAVKSGHSVGKSEVAACAALWYINALWPSIVVTTSSTWANLSDILWSRLHRVVKNAPVDVIHGGRLLSLKIILSDEWGIHAVSPNEPEAIGGYHSETGVLVIVDEASALTKAHEEAILGMVTSERSRVLYIGNPLRPEGPFFNAFRSPVWATATISSADSPNVVEGRDVIRGIATRAWVEARKLEWGAESNEFKARVLGEFPETAVDVLIPLVWVEAAMERKPIQGVVGVKRMGVDVARYGSDRTVFVTRDNVKILEAVVFPRQSLMQTAGAIQAKAKECGITAENIFVDDTGLGGGVTDALRERGLSVQAVNFGAGAKNAERFANVRSECYWNLREAIKPDSKYPLGIDKKFAALAKECATPHYSYTQRGQIVLESKDEIRKRLGRSPDEGDALALTYASPGARMTVSLL